MKYLAVAFLVFLPFICLAAPSNEEITSLPNLTEPFRSKHYAGYLPISDTKQLFYWYIESEGTPADDPVVLWLNGGPGCASMEGLFIEMGPFRVKNNGESVTRNPWTWNRIANIIYLDAPAGVGFSYYNNTNLTFTDDQVANDNYEALKLWFKKFPERKTNDFFVAGESYAGTYVPMLSSKIVNSTDFPNFKGMLIGNGCVDDQINFNTKLLYHYYHGLTDESTFQDIINRCCKDQDCDFYSIAQKNNTCGNDIVNLSYSIYDTGYDPYFLYFACYLNPNLPYPPHNDDMQINVLRQQLIKKQLPWKYQSHISEYKSQPTNFIQGQPDCASHNDHIPYLNTPEVRSILRIPDNVPTYAMCNYNLSMKYVSQYSTMTSFFNSVINANKSVALFNGDADTLCNVVENSQFIQKNLKRKVIQKSSPWTDPVQLPKSVGLWTEYDGISLVTIKGGGHFPAATEQKPKETFQMFQNFVKNQNYSTPVPFDKEYQNPTTMSTTMSTTTSGAGTSISSLVFVLLACRIIF